MVKHGISPQISEAEGGCTEAGLHMRKPGDMTKQSEFVFMTLHEMAFLSELKIPIFLNGECVHVIKGGNMTKYWIFFLILTGLVLSNSGLGFSIESQYFSALLIQWHSNDKRVKSLI